MNYENKETTDQGRAEGLCTLPPTVHAALSTAAMAVPILPDIRAPQTELDRGACEMSRIRAITVSLEPYPRYNSTQNIQVSTRLDVNVAVEGSQEMICRTMFMQDDDVEPRFEHMMQVITREIKDFLSEERKRLQKESMRGVEALVAAFSTDFANENRRTAQHAEDCAKHIDSNDVLQEAPAERRHAEIPCICHRTTDPSVICPKHNPQEWARRQQARTQESNQ